MAGQLSDTTTVDHHAMYTALAWALAALATVVSLLFGYLMISFLSEMGSYRGGEGAMAFGMIVIGAAFVVLLWALTYVAASLRKPH